MREQITLVSVTLTGTRPVVSLGRAGVVPTSYTHVTWPSMRRLCRVVNNGAEWRIRVNRNGFYAHRIEAGYDR